MEKKKSRGSKRKKVTIIIVSAAVIIGAAFVTFRVQAARSGYANSQTLQTMILEKTDITRTVSVSGVVESARVRNVYSTQSYPVKEIFVEVGDPVKTGDLLAELDMSRLLSDISQTEINLRSSIASAEEEIRSNANSIVNAQTSLESSQLSLERQQLSVRNAEKDLRDAERRRWEEFDSYTYDNIIADAELTLERKLADFEKAQKDLEDALNNFDDYSYQNSIADAKLSLDRKNADLEEAILKLSDEKKGKSDTLVSYENAVADAEKNRDRKRVDYMTAQNDYNDALNDYYYACFNSGGSYEAESAAWSKAENAYKSMVSAGRAVDDAITSLERAVADLKKARENTVDSAENSVNAARNSASDAQLTYDRAVTNLERAQRDAVESASDRLMSTQNAYSDAQRAYDKAVNDKIRAIDDSADSDKTKVENAQRSYTDSLRQLEASQNNVTSAQNSFDQAESRPASQGTNVEIQELNLKKLYDQLAEGKIYATSDGVITEINAKVGAAPSGVLFVIEDTEDLYVSARVREHSVTSVHLGQEAVITTDATGDVRYEGTVSYISPKAVSAAGSTSVEFEVRAGLNKPDTTIRIGMNAFLDIVTAQKSGVYAVPNSVIVTNERGSFVYALEDDERREIAVNLGVKTMVNAEISSDELSDGMQLIIDPDGLLANPDDITFPAMWGR